MGAQLSKGGVAAEGKAAADPAAAKANGQVSKAALTRRASAGSHMAHNAHWQHGCHGRAQGRDGGVMGVGWAVSCCSSMVRAESRPTALLGAIKSERNENGWSGWRGPPAEQPSSSRARARSARPRPAFVNSVCCSRTSPPGARLQPGWAELGRNVCLHRVFSHELAVVGQTVAHPSNKRCEANECKGCKCALLEAHFAELQTKPRRAPLQTRSAPALLQPHALR